MSYYAMFAELPMYVYVFPSTTQRVCNTGIYYYYMVKSTYNEVHNMYFPG